MGTKFSDSFQEDSKPSSEGILGYARGRLSIQSFTLALTNAVIHGIDDGFARATVTVVDKDENSRILIGVARLTDNNCNVSWRMKVQGGEFTGDVTVNCKKKKWRDEMRRHVYEKCNAALPQDTEARMKLVLRK